MKKCPVCGSVNMDQDYICGVCGGDLAGAIPVDETFLDQPAAQAVTVEPRRLNKRALLFVLTGPALSVLGLVFVLNLLNLGSEPLALAGVLILVLGLLTSAGIIGAGPSLRRLLQYKIGGGGFPAAYGSHDPRPREVEAEESQSSLEEQDEDYRTREERKKERFD